MVKNHLDSQEVNINGSHFKNASFAFENAVPENNWRQPTLWKA